MKMMLNAGGNGRTYDVLDYHEGSSLVRLYNTNKPVWIPRWRTLCFVGDTNVYRYPVCRNCIRTDYGKKVCPCQQFDIDVPDCIQAVNDFCTAAQLVLPDFLVHPENWDSTNEVVKCEERKAMKKFFYDVRVGATVYG